MNRRGFLTSIMGAVGGIALNQAVPTWPFRVFSFPTEIVVPKNNLLTLGMVHREALRILKNNLVFTDILDRDYDKYFPTDGNKLITVCSPVRASLRRENGLAIDFQKTLELKPFQQV